MGHWLTLSEAKNQSSGNTEWWKIEGCNGKSVSPRQHRPGAPEFRPVWMSESGTMYIGKWKNNEWHGFGVCHRPDGRVIVGNRKKGVLTGLVVRTWVASSPKWKANEDENSPIQSRAKDDETRKTKVGRPFIYIGKYNHLGKCDKRATVILKDGTTRVGPWDDNNPVGDWWDHKVGKITPHKYWNLLGVEDEGLGVEGRREKKIAPAPQDKTQIKQQQIQEIAKWLAHDVIGFDADWVQMEMYASELHALGFENSAMIQRQCTPTDIDKFAWMSAFHKSRLISCGKLDHAPNASLSFWSCCCGSDDSLVLAQ